MKRVLMFLIFLIFLILIGIYWFIPAELHISESVKLQSSLIGTFRNVSNMQEWNDWWPGEKTSDNSLLSRNSLVYEDDTFRITNQFYNDLLVTIYNNSIDSAQTTMLFIPLVKDTFLLDWRYNVKTSLNPYKRILQYNHALKAKGQFSIILHSLQVFFNNSKNIYGIRIIETSTRDTLLVSTDEILNNYPTSNDIYNLIEQLKKYIKTSCIKQTGQPMLNISEVNNKYKVMVALPVNKAFEPEENIFYKKMVPGAFLVTTVRGGDSAVSFANRQIQQYFIDHQRFAAAIPFQILVTDRSKEKDTAKWITKLYFPVMN